MPYFSPGMPYFAHERPGAAVSSQPWTPDSSDAKRSSSGSRRCSSARAPAQGAIVLLAGEAGVGKTRLAAELAGGADALVLARRGHARAARRRTARSSPRCARYLRAQPGGARRLRAAAPPPRAAAARARRAGAAAADRATLFEALRCALARAAAATRWSLLDDLHWSDEATLEVLAALAEPLADLPVLVVAAYRSDGLPRDARVRRLRHDLRRAGRLEEIALAPLDLAGDRARCSRASLAAPPAPALARAIHDRTRGHPVLRRGARRARCASAARSRPAGAGSSWPATATCRCPTPCATRC